MASVGPKVVRQLSFLQKVKSAFRNWYIYACGYRQLGNLFFFSSFVLNKQSPEKESVRELKVLKLTCILDLVLIMKCSFIFFQGKEVQVPKCEILFQFRLVVVC